MSDYTASRVLSLRIPNELLDGVRERAKAEGRSVSGQIVFFVREQVDPVEPAKPPQKISGWLSHRPVPGTHADFRRGRAEASAQMAEAVRRKARAK